MHFSIDGYDFRVIDVGRDDRMIIEIWHDLQWEPLGLAALYHGESVWFPIE